MLSIQKIVFLLSAAFLLQMGCASKGFNRGSLKEQAAVNKPSFDDKEIKEAFNKKPNLPKPFKLAVYFKGPAWKNGSYAWRWTDQDKSSLDELAKELKDERIVSEVFPLIDSIVEETDVRSLRLTAAKHQADALLIVSGASEVDRYINKWGWSYILLVPTLFVQGSEADAIFVTSASLWDVKNGYLYLTAESEGIVKDKYAAAFGKSDKDLMNESRSVSLNNLKQELKKMIKGAKP